MLLCSRTLFGTVLLLFAAVSVANTPLLMEGKKSLYQRVLTVPDAKVHAEPGNDETQSITPFSILYVYERQDGWIKVGHDSFGKTLGWIPETETIVWNQALTVSFKDPQDIQRVMLFGEKNDLQKLVDDYDREGYNALYQKVTSESLGKDSPVIALQPEAHVDIRDNFYLVPIKQHEDVYLGNEQARLLQIASVPLNERPEAQATKAAQSANAEAKPVQSPGRSYRSGIHFVIDSTQSMGPYIDRTREVVRGVYRSIAQQGLNDQVNFALTAYRDNLNEVPELDYLTRTYVDLEQGVDADRFFQNVDTLEPSTVSSRDFREDAYAGIKAALDNTNWSGFDARYVVLITDAGARESYDSLGATRLSAEALRQLAYDKGVSIWVMHLRTPAERANHERAEEQYKQLSYYPGIGDFYYGVELGQVDEFGTVLETLANQISQQVLATVNGVLPIPLPDQRQLKQPAQDKPEQTQLAALQARVAQLGNALLMKYLHREEGKPLPKVFNAWMVDKDFNQPEKSSVEVRVLMTRDQLSDLKNVMQQVLDLAEEGVLSPKGFINDLKSLAATVSRDPSAVAGSTTETGKNLAEMGYMREYIEDLPYTGEVMNLTLERWDEWSAKDQVEFMQRLESKINYYQALHDHTDLWVTPGGGPVNGNSVFPVTLNLLP